MVARFQRKFNMLVSVNIKNFRSIKAEIELNVNAGSDKDHSNFLIDTPHCPLLAATAIYGSNATGKSNIVRAMGTMAALVRTSFRDETMLSRVIAPFAFDSNTPQQASEFDMTFIVDNILYQYGFSADKHQIHSEWLYFFESNKPKTIFTRDWSITEKAYSYEFDQYTGDKHNLTGITTPSTLFLSTAGRFQQETVKSVYDWFEKLLVAGVDPLLPLDFLTINQIENDIITRKEVTEFLLSADFNIVDFTINKEADPLKKQYRYDLNSDHLVNNIKYSLPYNEESSGTKRMFSCAGVILTVLKQGGVLVLDELNNFLHPLLVRYIISLFGSKEKNPHNAQLIFTTHETSILTTDFIRRDQVWFCDKNQHSATELYALQEFDTKKTDNIEHSYLAGRFDAIPLVKGM